MTPKTDLRGELAEIVGIVSHARVQAAAGDRFSLARLPDRIATVCQAIETLPGDAARPYQAVLEKLIDDLDTITGLVTVRSAELQARLLAARGPADSETTPS